MSSPGNLFVPYMRRGEFAKLLEHCSQEPPLESSWSEHSLSENGDVWASARARVGQELSWAASISQVCGGFCMVSSEVPAVFYAGQRLNDSPHLDWASCFAKSTGLQNIPRQPMLNGELAETSVPEPLPEIWTRAAFLFTRAENAAAADSTAEWDWSEQLTPAGVSILMMDRVGACDPSVLIRLSKAFDNYGTAVEMQSSGTCRSWWLDPAATATSGEGHDAAEVLDAWYDLAKIVGEGAGCIRWRRHVPGLGQRRDSSQGVEPGSGG
jgi:hypothetical protein